MNSCQQCSKEYDADYSGAEEYDRFCSWSCEDEYNVELENELEE
ncbi:hypothetical protein [Lysinibacillus sp. 54212]